MDGCICSVKKSHYMKESMAQADPPKESSRVKKKMAGCYLSLQMSASGFLKNIYCLYKNVVLQINSLISSCSQKLRYPEKNSGYNYSALSE